MIFMMLVRIFIPVRIETGDVLTVVWRWNYQIALITRIIIFIKNFIKKKIIKNMHFTFWKFLFIFWPDVFVRFWPKFCEVKYLKVSFRKFFSRKFILNMIFMINSELEDAAFKWGVFFENLYAIYLQIWKTECYKLLMDFSDCWVRPHTFNHLCLPSRDWPIFWIRNFVYLCWPISRRKTGMIRRVGANPESEKFSKSL